MPHIQYMSTLYLTIRITNAFKLHEEYQQKRVYFQQNKIMDFIIDIVY